MMIDLSMHFHLRELNTATAEFRASALPEHQAYGENIVLEERVADGRRAVYEGAMGPAATKDGFEERHNAWINNHINRKLAIPDTFLTANAGAFVPQPDADQILVRIEDLTWVAESHFGLAPDEVAQVFHEDKDRFEALVQIWNHRRDRRPMFAAFAGDLVRFGDWRSNWQMTLRNLLGLGHLLASDDAPRLLALMEYRAGRILAAGDDIPPAQSFAAPTVIDQRLNPYFFPSPSPGRGSAINFGRAVNLDGSGTLVCEVVHRHIDYEASDVKAIAVVRMSVSGSSLADLRQGHLAALRRQPGWAEYGVVP